MDPKQSMSSVWLSMCEEERRKALIDSSYRHYA